MLSWTKVVLLLLNKKMDESSLNIYKEKMDTTLKILLNELSRIRTGRASPSLLEPIIIDIIKAHETNFKGVGQPLRIALTGSKFGPGIYDIIISLGNEEIAKRLNKIR